MRMRNHACAAPDRRPVPAPTRRFRAHTGADTPNEPAPTPARSRTGDRPAVAAALLPGGGTATAAPGDTAAPAPGRCRLFADDRHQAADVDNRTGTAAPTPGSAASLATGVPVRWNAVRHPAALGPARRTALATGLRGRPGERPRGSTSSSNQALFGIDAAAVAAMDTVWSARSATGAVVTAAPALR